VRINTNIIKYSKVKIKFNYKSELINY